MADTETNPEPGADAALQDAPATDTTTDDEGKGGKTAILADLARERDNRQQVAAERDALAAQLAAITAAINPDADQPISPDDLTAELDKARAETAAARTQLAVLTNTPTGVDAAALLDSTAFHQHLATVDTADTGKVRAAIEKFVADHPRFRTVSPAAGARDAAASSPASPASRSFDDIIRGR